MDKSEYILVVDDEKSIRAVIADTLRENGFEVETAASPAEALRAFEKRPFDLALLDLKMPGPMDGVDLLSVIHTRWPLTVVILMTGYGTLDSAIAALREGASDYITKPASMKRITESVERGLAKRREESHQQQLIAHIEEALRELKRDPLLATVETSEGDRFIQTTGLTIDRQKRLVVRGSQPVDLTATEFDVLDYLARHKDRIVTSCELVKAIQGYDLAEVDARPLVRVHIVRLRQKLEDDAEHPRIVLNVRGKGYRFAG